LSGVARILFDHIAIAVPAMSQAAPFLAGELGGVPDAGCPSMARAFMWGTYAYEGGGSIEVLEPLGASGFLHRFLAERLKKDLEGRGHEVWFDAERLIPGGDWERYIEEGLEWAAALPGEGRVVLIMTPHSVRRPDGYCLNEIARALSRRLTVIPVMLVWCEPPLSICRVQWLDMRDCVPIDTRGDKYEAKLGVLAAALEGAGTEFEGAFVRLLHVLEPLPFDADLLPHLTHFTGRTSMRTAVATWLACSGLPGFRESARRPSPPGSVTIPRRWRRSTCAYAATA
jgi:hypothetical protein